MNYHNDEWIMAGLQQHYDEASKRIEENRIIAIVLRGSQNYGLDTKDSDIDSWCIYIPKEEELIQYPHGKDKIEIILDNHEQIACVDIRWFFYALRLRSFHYIELLYSQWKIINPLYKEEFNFIVDLADDLVLSNKGELARSLCYYASENAIRVNENIYPSRRMQAMKYGYDPKSLSVIYRQYLLLQLLNTDYSFSNCFHPTLGCLIKDAKFGNYDAVTAIRLTRFIVNDLERLKNSIKNNFPTDEKRNTELINKIKEIERKIICDYYGESATALYGSS